MNTKKLLFMPFLVIGALTTSQNILGMQNNQIEVCTNLVMTSWELHCAVCRWACHIEDIHWLATFLSNDCICNLIEHRTVDTALVNAAFADHIETVQVIIENEHIRSKMSGVAVINALREAIRNRNDDLVSILLKLDLLPVMYLEFMLKDVMSKEVRLLFNQAVQRKSPV
jgi:hypothetical protein